MTDFSEARVRKCKRCGTSFVPEDGGCDCKETDLQPCKCCGELVELRWDQEGICDECFAENEKAIRNFEANKQYRNE